jgi:hypothetical protein
MIDQIKNHLQLELISEGAFDIKGKNISEEHIIECKKELNDVTFQIYIFYQLLNDLIIIQIFTTYLIPIKDPEKSQYQLLENLSSRCIIGFLYLTEEASRYYINYKSQYVSRTDSFTKNDSFKTHLKVSFDMIDMNYREIFDKK